MILGCALAEPSPVQLSVVGVTLGCRPGRVGILTSIERTAYPRFKRLITAHELHLFFSPTREEAAWAAERMDADGHQLALLLALKSYQRMGRFPKPDEYPEMVVDFVRRAVELPEGTMSLWATGRTAERQRTEVRRRVGATYDQARARRIAEESIRKEAAAKNRPADLINIALEKVVEAGRSCRRSPPSTRWPRRSAAR
ncbi:hypothetical protein SLUN_28555 [Streptomyces lunaelactis]|uniref:DUF4158 domain-containing protein n=1 Tax=Streptomyces lunaelactis TaxID=1535768 RepID=A0A2R4T8W4_9ACTN|nr:hypothetical protein SLUN_28555 [Streptomyces lunaelactis]